MDEGAGGWLDINVRLGVSGPAGNGRLLVFLTPQTPEPQTLMNGIPSNVHYLVTTWLYIYVQYIIKTFSRLPSRARLTTTRNNSSNQKQKDIFLIFFFSVLF